MKLFGKSKRVKALEAEISRMKESTSKEKTQLLAENQELRGQKKEAEQKFENLASQKSDYRKAWERAHDFIERKGYEVSYAYTQCNNAISDVSYSGKSNMERKLGGEVERLGKLVLELGEKVPRRGNGGRFVKK